MSGKGHVSPQDRQLFRSHVGRVEPVDRGAAPRPPRPRPRPHPLQRDADERAVVAEMASASFDPAELETGEELVYQGPGLQQRQFRKLRRGMFVVEAVLDLHGLGADAAREAVAGFITRVRLEGKRCVRIIHGKGRGSRHGRPVLKTRLAHWLRQRGDVLGFSSARAMDGGTGAVYVLIRRDAGPRHGKSRETGP